VPAYSEELKEEIRRRHQQGETIAQLAAKTGIPRATIKCFASTADRARSARKLAEAERAAAMSTFSPRTPVGGGQRRTTGDGVSSANRTIRQRTPTV